MNILFVCEGNMMRSQIAEVVYNQLSGTKDATSAGAIATLDDRISERAKLVLDEINVKSDDLYSKQVTLDMIDKADKIVYFPSIYMPDNVKNNPKAELWDVVDPHYHKDEGIQLVRSVRDEIVKRVKEMLND